MSKRWSRVLLSCVAADLYVAAAQVSGLILANSQPAAVVAMIWYGVTHCVSIFDALDVMRMCELVPTFCVYRLGGA